LYDQLFQYEVKKKTDVSKICGVSLEAPVIWKDRGNYIVPYVDPEEIHVTSIYRSSSYPKYCGSAVNYAPGDDDNAPTLNPTEEPTEENIFNILTMSPTEGGKMSLPTFPPSEGEKLSFPTKAPVEDMIFSLPTMAPSEEGGILSLPTMVPSEEGILSLPTVAPSEEIPNSSWKESSKEKFSASSHKVSDNAIITPQRRFMLR
jgi:hypothetical protein